MKIFICENHNYHKDQRSKSLFPGNQVIRSKEHHYSKTGHPQVACLFNYFGLTTRDSRITSHDSRSLPHKFPLIRKRALACDHLKILMKAGKIIKTAFIAKLFYAQAVFDQEFAGIAHADLDQKL